MDEAKLREQIEPILAELTRLASRNNADHGENFVLALGVGWHVDEEIRSEAMQRVMTAIAAAWKEREQQLIEDTIWNIMSPKTEGLFVKRKPIEDAIISMVGYDKYKAMQEAVDASLQSAPQQGGEQRHE